MAKGPNPSNGNEGGGRDDAPAPGAVAELQREVRNLHKIVDHQALQILSLGRYQQNSRLEETVAALSEDVAGLREASQAAGAQLRRQRAELAAAAAELGSLRRINAAQRSELHRLTGEGAEEVRRLQAEARGALAALAEERAEGERLRSEFGEVRAAVEAAAAGREREESERGRELLEVREYAKRQSVYVRKCLEAVGSEVAGLREAKERLVDRGGLDRVEELGRELTEAREKRTGVLGEALNKCEELEEEGKGREERLARLEGEVKETSDLKSELARVRAAMEELVGETEERLEAMAAEAQGAAGRAERAVEAGLRESRREAAEAAERAAAEAAAAAAGLRSVVEAGAARTLDLAAALGERMDEIDTMHDDMQDRVYEIDKNRRNNLVFYGLRSGGDEGGEECARIVRSLFNTYLQVTREIPLTKVEKLWNGPSFRGVKPIQVSFQLFRDREEILRKSPRLLRGTNVYVTEDFSRKVRKHREELMKFAREARGLDPTSRCLLQYDRLYVGNQAYLYNEVEGRVEEVKMRSNAGTTGDGSQRRKEPHLPLVLSSGAPGHHRKLAEQDDCGLSAAGPEPPSSSAVTVTTTTSEETPTPTGTRMLNRPRMDQRTLVAAPRRPPFSMDESYRRSLQQPRSVAAAPRAATTELEVQEVETAPSGSNSSLSSSSPMPELGLG